MVRTADTSFLYAAFNDKDPRHRDARAELAKPQPLNIPFVVLVELLALVSHRTDRKTARRVCSGLIGLSTVTVLPTRDPGRALAIWQQRTRLSLVDVASIQMCLERGDALLSYDRRQSKALAELRSAKGA